ncbi:uncharacterized protein CMU_041910 [Cryptosporidium muris RN66]|uniref:PH domain-containing protein n=1 Tax=Cryptosporidium muris (strain RN66) TaxID=441375 RepID=B6AA77_CRYMR|nr:uncharacterized protein CMU_041910 [Cryptosporidium muris RN66]EEA05118.1 hypothetical protein, conserved [Cryptosporidium muris RN66]|eukprot:XP_002139467.1 hypothetical protein [Cryptosporidium muris RN66]
MQNKEVVVKSYDPANITNKVELRVQDASLLSLARAATVDPECCGWLYVLNNKGSAINTSLQYLKSLQDSWEHYYFNMKGGMMFGSSKKDGSTLEVVYILCDMIISSIDSSTALQKEYITREEEASLQQKLGKEITLIMLLHHNQAIGIESNPVIFASSSSNVASRWCIALNKTLQYGQMRYTDEYLDDDLSNNGSKTRLVQGNSLIGSTVSFYRTRDMTQVSQQIDKLKNQLKQMENTNKTLESRNDQLQNQLKKLQSTLNVTEKATSEAVEQKTVELTQIKENLSNIKSERDLLIEEKTSLYSKLYQLQRENQNILMEKYNLRNEFQELQNSITSAIGGDNTLQKLIVRLQYLKNSSQKLLIENKKYKKEIQDILNHYRQEQEKSIQQLNTVKELLSQQDVFQLLIRQMDLVQAKLQYQEEAWKMPENQAENLLFWIQQLQNQWKVDEAVARASYLKHRSIMLGEQMQAYTLGLPLPKHYTIIQELLKKLQCVFREEEFAIATKSELFYRDIQPLNNEGGSQDNGDLNQPYWVNDNFQEPPLAIVPSIFGGIENKSSNGIDGNTSDTDTMAFVFRTNQYTPKIHIDLLSPPEKKVPESEYTRLKSTYRELKDRCDMLESENENLIEKIQKMIKYSQVYSKRPIIFRQHTGANSLTDIGHISPVYSKKSSMNNIDNLNLHNSVTEITDKSTSVATDDINKSSKTSNS